MRAAVFLIIVGTAGSVQAAGEWPQFLGPTGDSHSAATELPVTWSESENVVWKTPLHGRGWSSPVIWDNQIWMTTATEDGKQQFALCVDRGTGKILHDIHLFDNEKPSEIHVLNSYASPSAAIEEGRVYITFGSYGTACLDTKTAEVLWKRRDLPCEHFRGPGSSPIIFGNLLILHYDGFDFQYIIAMDKRTGDTVWKSDRNIDYGSENGDFKKAFCTPQVFDVNGRLELISPTSKATMSLDPLTGKEFWRIRYTQFSVAAKPIYDPLRQMFYINTGFGKADLYAVRAGGEGDITDTHVAWKSSKSIPSKPTQLLVGDALYMIHDAGTATCLDAVTGDVVWQQRVGGNFSATPLYADGRIYLLSQEGPTTVIAASRDYQVLAENKLDDGFMSSPAVAGKSLFLRTRSALYRIEQPAAK
ncbi:MAG TPA: PQQ-binding-like beta-propeller repeat protein [Planctomycetaceae bacterium]|nr:PQQ-binding-like beta-propeller repeat protein [Planctomycetaceae bacterium]